MQENPFAASAQESAPSGTLRLDHLVVGALATMVISSVDAWLSPMMAALPGLPSWTALLTLPLGAVGLAVLLGILPRASLWPVTLVVPVLLLVLVSWIEGTDQAAQLGPVMISLKLMAWQGVWTSTAGGLALAAWLGVPVRRLPAFLAAVGLKAQAVAVGMQFLVPGLALLFLFPLLAVVAARNEPGFWLLGSLQAILRSPGAWAVALLGGVLAIALGLAMPFLWGIEAGQQAFLEFGTMPYPMALLSTLVPALVTGASLAFASSLLPPPVSPRAERDRPQTA